MSEPEKPPPPSAPAQAPAAAEAPAPAADEKTQPFKLKQQADKSATRRRRTTAAELVVKRPRHPEVRVPLDRTETIIGRDPRCDIVLADDSASRRHARIARNDGGFFEIADLGSRNGILVGDERVDRMTLLDGDSFVVGDTIFTIAVGPIVGSES